MKRLPTRFGRRAFLNSFGKLVAGPFWRQSFSMEPLTSRLKLRTWPATSCLPIKFCLPCLLRHKNVSLCSRHELGRQLADSKVFLFFLSTWNL
eukprot:g19741.t1